MKKALFWTALLGISMFLLSGCQKQEPAQEEQVTEKKQEAEPMKDAEEQTVPQVTRAGVDEITFKEGEKPRVELETTLGTLVLELWPDVAPTHCKNFVYLAQSGFYDSLKVHRVVKGFMLQSGCPLGTGTGGPGYQIDAEFSDKNHVKGTLSMARSANPNSAGSQFFICLATAPHLNGKYTAFGQTVEGMEVLDKFNQVETVASPGGEKSKPVEPLFITKATVLSGVAE